MIILVTSALSVISALLVREVFDKALFPPGQDGPDLPLLYVLVASRVGRRRRAARRQTQVSLAEMSAITQESLSVSGVLLSKSFGRQAYEVARYRAENDRQVELQVRQAMTGRTFFGLTQAFF